MGEVEQVAMTEERKRQDEQIVQLACFLVGGQQYVVDIMRIREIINPLPLTKVPSSSDVVEGVINLRGVIIPVVDLRKMLEVAPEQRSDKPKIVVVMVENCIFGLLVDDVVDVVRVPKQVIASNPRPGLGKLSDKAYGVCEFQGRLLILLNLKKLLEPAMK